MTADSSTSVAHSGESHGVNSPSSRRSLPSPWAQIVRGNSEPLENSVNTTAPRSPAEQNINTNTDQAPALELETGPAAGDTEGSESSNGNGNGNANATNPNVKKSVWNKPSANGVVEGSTTPVMGAASWPALSESTKPVPKSSSLPLSSPPAESSSKLSDGLGSVSQAPVISQPPQKPAKTNANPNSNSNANHANHTHPVRQRSMKRGTGMAGASAGYNRPPPPPPPPLPPPFPVFDLSFGNIVPAIPAVLESPVREPPPYKGGWATRPMPMGGAASHSYGVPDNSSHRNPSRRNNFGPRPRGDGGNYPNNGYGGRRDHQDHHGPRSPSTRDLHIPHQMAPPPPPLPRTYFRQPHPGAVPFIAPQPIQPYGNPIGYDMAAPFLYVPPLEAYRGAPFPPNAAPPPMFYPVLERLHVKLLNQIEFYFSDDNLAQDTFLRSNMDVEGWVRIDVIAHFRRVERLFKDESMTPDIQIILSSLRDSGLVEVQGDKLRRRNEWRKYVLPLDSVPANSESQSPHGITDSLAEEVSMQKLTFEEVTTKENCTSEMKENDDKRVGDDSSLGSTDLSGLANGKVSAEE